jgi:hypothetical protein
MANPVYSYKIGVGYNVASGSLVNIETIRPTNDRLFYPPDTYGSYRSGLRKTRLNGLDFLSGYPSLVWRFDYMTRAQLRYLMDTYCSSGLSGKVTINTTTNNTTTYSRLNAVMHLPDLAEAQKNTLIFTHVPVVFQRLATAS